MIVLRVMLSVILLSACDLLCGLIELPKAARGHITSKLSKS